MKLSQIGEFGLIDLISKHEKNSSSTIVGIGDDCAVLKMQDARGKKQKSSKYQLITTDTFIQDVHFKIRTPKDYFYLGRKAMTANVSDIASMGGWPTHALVTIGLLKNISVKDVQELYRGIDSIAKKLKIEIVGGDTIASPKAILVSVTLLGEVEKTNLVLRSTARVGDLVCVTGRFGGEARNKFKLQRSNIKIMIKEARKIAKSKLATSMIDSSDGLVRSVLEICKASKVGARIFEDRVPIAKGATLEQALYGGEEYELVFTTRRKNIYQVIGKIVPAKQGIKLVDRHGKIKSLKSGGYEHFK